MKILDMGLSLPSSLLSSQSLLYDLQRPEIEGEGTHSTTPHMNDPKTSRVLTISRNDPERAGEPQGPGNTPL